MGIDLSLFRVLLVWLRLWLDSCGMVILKVVISGVSGRVILLLMLFVECLFVVGMLSLEKFICLLEEIIVVV